METERIHYTTEMIEAAADWWTGKLANCRQSGLSLEERASGENRGYETAELLLTLACPKVTVEQAALFRAALVAGLSTATPFEQRWTAVDYHPDRVLADALMVAGIPEHAALPIKTSVQMTDDGRVLVRYGYGAAGEQIYPEMKETPRE